MADDRDLAPVPGSSPLALAVFAVMCGSALLGLVWAGIASLSRDDLGPTLIGLGVMLAVSALGLGATWMQRRDYLRKVRNGDVIERRKHDANDVPGPNTYY